MEHVESGSDRPTSHGPACHALTPPQLQSNQSRRQVLTTATLSAANVKQRLVGEGLVVRSEIRRDRAGRSYAAMTVGGGNAGTVEARWWDLQNPTEQCPQVGAVYRFTGEVDQFNGTRQLRVLEAQPVDDADLSMFMRATRRSQAELQAELEATIASLDTDLAALVRHILSGTVYERFCLWPAAQHHHGAVRHGLLAHSLGVARIARCLAAAYPDCVQHDEGIAIAAALLHDVGKVRTLPAIAGGALPEEASQLDHVTLSVLMVRTAAAQAEPQLAPERLSQLLHTILAHHGRKEWGAPVEPQTAEAWLVHLADYAESRLWQWSGEEQP